MVERVCQRCSKSFLVRPHKVKEGKGKFCSRACADYGWEEPCQNCGELVHRTEHHAKTQKHVFCSRLCYGLWKQKRITRVCQNCGKEFSNKLSKMNNERGVYCCQACFDIARKCAFVTLICQQCHKSFERPETFFNSPMYRGKYCSATCMGLARQMPDSSRSAYDHKFTDYLKIEIRQRDNFTCQLCGRTEEANYRALDCHHIDYDKTNCHPSNLISLCRFCHPKTNYNRSYWTSFFVAYVKQHSTCATDENPQQAQPCTWR